MKCLISVGLILPALAAIIGVAAWAVSADVVMNANGNRVNKADNQLLQELSGDRRDDGRRDIFRDNHIDQNPEPNARNVIPERQHTERPFRRTTTLAPTSSTADVSEILSKLISATNIASGGSGPRFVVVAPLPDHARVVSSDEKDTEAISPISRADHHPTAKFEESWKPTRNEDSNHDLMQSASYQKHHQIVQAPAIFHQSLNNITNRVGLASGNKPTNYRRTGEQQPSFVIDLSSNNNNNNKRRGFNAPFDLSGFEPFMSPETLLGSPSVAIARPPQVPGFVATGPFKNRNPQKGFLNSHRDLPIFEQKHPIFNEPPSFIHNSNSPPPPLPHGRFGLKPIQQHHPLLHHHDSPMVAEESNHWGAVSFHPPPPALYGPKPPEGISLSISSPEKSHISAEPISVIKSFFLPFLPKPKINMNARVVFGVVLDKGIGLGGQKKDAGHLRPY